MAMRYHWGLGIGHVYSHGKEDHSQQSSTAPSTSGNENPSDISHTAQNADGAPGDNVKENEAEEDSEELNASEGRLEVSRVGQDIIGGAGVDNTEELDSDASTTDSDEGLTSDEEDEETLELYDTYQSERAAAEVVS